jgi:hypothetical protein
MANKNTSIKFTTTPVDLLGSKLATLLFLLNEPSARIWKMAVKGPSDAESATRARYSLNRGKERPSWLHGIAGDHPAFATLAGVSELQDILRKFAAAWIETGEVLVGKGLAWKTTGVHDPRMRSLYEKDSEFRGYLDWRLTQKFTADEGGARWGDDIHLTPVSVGRQTPRNQAFAILQQLFVSSGPERYHIGKCTECGVFFWRESLSPAKRGLFCSTDCQNKRSSKDTRSKQRRVLAASRLDRAASAFAKSALSHEAKAANNHRLKAAIVRTVNAGQGSNEKDITSTWVSRHWRDIVKRAARIRKDGSK